MCYAISVSTSSLMVEIKDFINFILFFSTILGIRIDFLSLSIYIFLCFKVCMLIGRRSHPILHEGLILLIEGYCKNKSIASTRSIDKNKGSHSKKSKKEDNVKGKEKALKLKPSISQK